MDNKEKEFIKEVNIDKAKNKTVACILLTINSLVTYLLPFIFGDLDFGIFFELLTLVFIIIARKYMKEYDEERSRRYVILSMIPIGWLLIYDCLTVITSSENIVELTVLGIDFILGELLIIANISVLFAIIKDLRKADNPEKYKESTDWFYERIDEKENQ